MPDFEDFFYRSADGLRLHARIYGSENARLPVICLPGLTRNAQDFHRLAQILSDSESSPRRVVAFDYRGRGESDRDADWHNYTVGNELADVLAGLDLLGIGRAFFVGTSRGGLIAQVLAAVRPDIIAGTVLNDIGPAIEHEGLVHISGYLAGAAKPATVAEAIAAQKRIHEEAFPALAEEDWAAMVEALYRIEDGVPVPDHDPAIANTLADIDPDKPLPTLWPQFEALAARPVLVIRGANSKLLSEGTVAEMLKRGKLVEALTADGQGHAPFLEIGGLPDRIAAFLDRAEQFP
ncbi:MAG: alpha/beta hydrolase [Rhizobiales bacterium]|nr:alpha/beta hydrolase [Hyphomicrobiales bacterium]